MCGNTGGAGGSSMNRQFQQPRYGAAFQGMNKPLMPPSFNQAPQMSTPSPMENPTFNPGPQMSDTNGGGFPPVSNPGSFDFYAMNPGFQFPTAPTGIGNASPAVRANPVNVPRFGQPPMSQGIMGMRDLYGSAKPLMIPPRPQPGGTTPFTPPQFTPPGSPPPFTPPGGTTPNTPPPTNPPPTNPPPNPPPSNGFLPDYVYDEQGRASQAPGTFDPRNPTGIPVVRGADGVERFAPIPFNPSMGQLGEYTTPRGTGFTGTRNNYNYFRGHLYGPAAAAGDPSFQNFLNQYGNQFLVR